MLIAEKVLLLLIDEKKNKLFSHFRILNGNYASGGLANAFLLDLVFQNRIVIEPTEKTKAKKLPKYVIRIIDETPLGDETLDTLFSVVKDYQRERLCAWMSMSHMDQHMVHLMVT